MNVRYHVDLVEAERQQWEALLAGASRSGRRVKRAQILLATAAFAPAEARRILRKLEFHYARNQATAAVRWMFGIEQARL